MALIGLRGGGEHGNLIGWAATSTALSRDTTVILTGMGGPASIKHNGTATTVSRFVFAGASAAEFATVYFSFKLMLPDVSAPSATQTFRWLLTNNGNLNVGGVRLAHNVTTGTFTLQALNADLSNAGSTATGNYFTAGQTHVISGKFIAGATGSIEINIDGVNIIPTTTINTTTSHPSGAAGGFSMAVAGTAHTRVYHYGDWLFDDAAYPDPTATVIARQFKSGTPTYDQWDLVGGGTKYGNISETPPSATLAIATASSTAALAQTALINSFSATETGKGSGVIGSGDTLLGVRVEAYARASSGNLGHTRLRVGGVDTDAQVANMTVGVLLRWGAVQTGVSLSDLNAGEAGFVKPVTGTARVYTVEDMWVLAAYAPAGITHYTIAAEAGSYALTGTAAGLRATRKIAAAAGTYALTGTAAGLKAGRKFAAAAGSYALTGSIAGLKRGRKVAAPAGSYSLTGASAGLLTTRRLGSGAGSYLLTGTPAGLIYSVADPVLTVETGAYALTGTAAVLRAVLRISAGAGSYALTGTAAELVHAEPHRVLAAAAGSYLIGGQPVAFIYEPLVPPIVVIPPDGGGGGGGFDWPSEAKKRSKRKLSEYLARAEAELLYGKSQPKKKSRRVDLKRLREIASEVPPERLAAAREIILEAREDRQLAREAATLALLDRIAAFYAAVAERRRLALLEAAALQARRDEIAEEERLLAVLAALEYQRLMDEEAAIVAVLMAA